jgi:hypothetical protein
MGVEVTGGITPEIDFSLSEVATFYPLPAIFLKELGGFCREPRGNARKIPATPPARKKKPVCLLHDKRL